MNFKNGYMEISTVGHDNFLVIASKSESPVFGLWKWPVTKFAQMKAWLVANDEPGFEPRPSAQAKFNAQFPTHSQAIEALRESIIAKKAEKAAAGVVEFKAKKATGPSLPVISSSAKVPQLKVKGGKLAKSKKVLKTKAARIPESMLKAMELGLCDETGAWLS